MEFSPPTPALLAVLFRSGKRSFLVPKGELPMWKSTLSQAGPALLPSCPAVPGQLQCPPVLSPALPRAVESPWSVQLLSDTCTDERLVLLRQDSPGTLDHLASLIIIILLWCAVQWSVQVHTLHSPFGNWWSVFSRIRVIQTSCTCRLKSCNPRLRARTAVSQCMSPQSHTWKFTDTEINLHTLPCSSSASSALSAMKIHIKNWVSQCYFPRTLLAAAHAFLAQNLAFHCYLLYSWSGFFSGFIYDFLSENPCISFVFNILKFSNSGFFQSSAAWLTANTPELHFLHYPGWFVCLETLFNCCFSFYPLLFSNFP